MGDRLSRSCIGVLCAAGVLVSACGSSSSTQATAAPTTGLTLGIMPPISNFVGFDEVAGALTVAKAHGDKLIFLSPNGNSQLEASDIQELIARHVSAILWGPSDQTTTISGFKAAQKAGIPVICFDSCLATQAISQQYNVRGFATADNTLFGNGLGQEAAAYIKANLGGTANVGLLTCETVPICKLRRAGLDAGLASVPGIHVNIVASQEAYTSANIVTPIATAMITAHPEMNMIITENNGGIYGGYPAIKSSGRKIVMFGMDMDPTIIAPELLSSDNILQGTSSQNPTLAGEDAMNMALKVLAGAKGFLDPWEVLVPTTGYTRLDPTAVQQYITANSAPPPVPSS
jgi:ABC-type sugar transport system substrate-binding protein